MRDIPCRSYIRTSLILPVPCKVVLFPGIVQVEEAVTLREKAHTVNLGGIVLCVCVCASLFPPAVHWPDQVQSLSAYSSLHLIMPGEGVHMCTHVPYPNGHLHTWQRTATTPWTSPILLTPSLRKSKKFFWSP